jgi:pyrophosphatase PpaX
LLDIFDAFVSMNDTEHHKPDPAPAVLALDRLGRNAENTLMVGDTLHDIHCAKRAGVISVLVAWSLAVPKDEQKNVADFVIDTPGELLSFLDVLNSR